MSQVIKEYFNPPVYGKGSGNPPCPIPHHIKLHDGRMFSVAELFNSVGEPTRIRLNTPLARQIGYQRVTEKSKTRDRSGYPNRKYTYEERVWHCNAGDTELMLKYSITKKEACRLRAQSNYICKSRRFHEDRGDSTNL